MSKRRESKEDKKINALRLKKNINKLNRSIAVIKLSPDFRELGVYPSITDAAVEAGSSASNIKKCCEGKLLTVGGFNWTYLDVNHKENRLLRIKRFKAYRSTKSGKKLKKCLKCNRIKTKDKFRRDWVRSDGRASFCKICSNKIDRDKARVKEAGRVERYIESIVSAEDFMEKEENSKLSLAGLMTKYADYRMNYKLKDFERDDKE